VLEKDPIYRFGEFALEPRERRLSGNGQPIALTPKVFDTLVLLVERAGHVATKEELLKALWPRGFVDEATLSNHVWQIRRALGDSAKTTRFIETVPKVGYRFVAPVTAVAEEASPTQAIGPRDASPQSPPADPGSPSQATQAPEISHQAPLPDPLKRAHASDLRGLPSPTRPADPLERAPSPDPHDLARAADPRGLAGPASRAALRGRRQHLAPFIALGVLVAGSALVFLLYPRSQPSTVPAVVRTPSTRVVALVGFNNLSRVASDGWLAPALTTMIGTELEAADEIRVVPYTLVHEATKDLEPPIAGGYASDTLAQLRKRLDADYVISGSYLSGTGTEDPPLRIDIALQDTRTGALIAAVSNQVGLSALNRMVNQTSATLRDKLGVGAPNPELLSSVVKAEPPTTDVARRVALALDAMEKYDAAHARDELLEAIAQAPGYAPAYLYLSQAWSALGYRQKALAAANQAANRAANLPTEQRLQVNAAVQTSGYQWKDASATWKELVALKPTSVEYRIAWIDTLLAAGDPTAALSALADLRSLSRSAGDPRIQLAAARIAAVRSDVDAMARSANDALRQSQIREAPGLIADARVELATAEMRQGKFEDARQQLVGAIAGYQALGNPHGEVQARSALASTYNSLQRLQDARDEYQRAMGLAQGIGDLGAVAAVYRDISSMLWLNGDRDGSQAAARRALDISRNTGDLRLQAWTLRALATIASDEAATDEVLNEYREVTTLTELSHDAGGHVWSLATNSDLLRMRGQLDEAQDNCQRARSEAATLSDTQFMVYSSFTCALLAVDRGETSAARKILDDLIPTVAHNHNTTYEGNALFVLGQLDFEAAQYAQAKVRLERAAKIFGASESETGEADALALLALCEQALGDGAARDRAIARTKELRMAITSREEIFVVDIALAELTIGAQQRAAAIARLQDLAVDAERRQWLSWSLEARLAEWQMLSLDGNAGAAGRVREEVEQVARKHGFRRVLERLNATEKRPATIAPAVHRPA
jgi:DNA-binding winged helix-turn-helix (wHTH) protein/tetratricopeptide (TPR) repeat protein/TolB-like protein